MFLTFNLGGYGNIGAAWIGVEPFDSKKTELLNLPWSRNLWGSGSSIYLAASRDQQRGDWTVALSLQVPLGERDSAAVTFENTPTQAALNALTTTTRCLQTAVLAGTWPGANQSRSSNYQQATLGWRNNNVELQGGGYGEKAHDDLVGARRWVLLC